MSSEQNITAIILAAGSSSRMGDTVDDKLLLSLAGKPVIWYSVKAFSDARIVSQIVIVYRDNRQKKVIENSIREFGIPIFWSKGGKERQDSVWSGLEASPKDTEVVLIHDGARPLITPNAVRKVAQAARDSGVACLARKVSDTIKRAKPAKTETSYSLETIDRSDLWAMETPQAFRYQLIKDAYQKVIESGTIITDDVAALESGPFEVKFIENERPNIKLTTKQDIAYVEFLLSNVSLCQKAACIDGS